MYALELNNRYYCQPRDDLLLTAPFGWNDLNKCLSILLFKDESKAIKSAEHLKILGGSYRDIRVKKLSKAEEEFLVCLRLKHST